MSRQHEMYALTTAYHSCFCDSLAVRGWTTMRSSVPSPALAKADFGQLSALPCVATLKFFILAHGPWHATPFAQSVGHFGKSRFHGFHHAPEVHHVIIPPDPRIKEGCFYVWFYTPREPPSPQRFRCRLGVPTREGPEGQDMISLSALPFTSYATASSVSLRVRP
jgi:hypothetical protein